MKLFSPAAIAAIMAGTAVVSGAAEILTETPCRYWSGYGNLTLGGNVFTGVGNAGLVDASGGQAGGDAQAISLVLSGVDPAIIPLLDAGARGCIAVLHRLIFDPSGTILLDDQVFDRGKIDTIVTDEVVGGQATITATVQTAAAALGRRGGRMRTDADQRLIKATDGAFKAISYAGEKELYWGGKRPAVAAAAVGGIGARFGLGSLPRGLPF